MKKTTTVLVCSVILLVFVLAYPVFNKSLSGDSVADGAMALPEKMIGEGFGISNNAHLKKWADGVINNVADQTEAQVKQQLSEPPDP
jgi:hypothetical protein